jgi:hypothetical protein
VVGTALEGLANPDGLAQLVQAVTP